MFWTSGNDVDLEGDWVWTEGGRREVGRVGRLVRRERGLYTQSGSLNTLVTQGSNLENSDN